mmetsp:Transcript_54303/g.151148  ORF Transcript_54303/g.151148 Transcript_54303/m.151148 type:complete len:203 (-) Transcript_54303:2577-3185(-)
MPKANCGLFRRSSGTPSTRRSSHQESAAPSRRHGSTRSSSQRISNGGRCTLNGWKSLNRRTRAPRSGSCSSKMMAQSTRCLWLSCVTCGSVLSPSSGKCQLACVQKLSTSCATVRASTTCSRISLIWRAWSHHPSYSTRMLTVSTGSRWQHSMTFSPRRWVRAQSLALKHRFANSFCRTPRIARLLGPSWSQCKVWVHRDRT